MPCKNIKSVTTSRVGDGRDGVLYSDVQNVVKINTSAFYLSESLTFVADLHDVRFFPFNVGF